MKLGRIVAREIDDGLFMFHQNRAQFRYDARLAVVDPDAAADISLPEQLDPAPEDVEPPVDLLRGDIGLPQREAAERGQKPSKFGLALRGAPVDDLLALLPQALHVLFLGPEAQHRQHHQAKQRDSHQAARDADRYFQRSSIVVSCQISRMV